MVTVSALEYVPAVDAACREVQRVLAAGGPFAVVTPGAVDTPNTQKAPPLPAGQETDVHRSLA